MGVCINKYSRELRHRYPRKYEHLPTETSAHPLSCQGEGRNLTRLGVRLHLLYGMIWGRIRVVNVQVSKTRGNLAVDRLDLKFAPGGYPAPVWSTQTRLYAERTHRHEYDSLGVLMSRLL